MKVRTLSETDRVTRVDELLEATYGSASLGNLDAVLDETIRPRNGPCWPFDWPGGGKAAVIEALRDRTKVPYRVKQAIGSHRRIEVGQVYVRHGSHVVLASVEEIDDLEAEAARSHSAAAK